MKKKVVLICIDGLRVDGVKQCGNGYVDELTKMGSFTFNAKTVFPSSTMPCHMSMFHSVPPETHGSMVWHEESLVPITNLFVHLCRSGAQCGMFHCWEPMGDINEAKIMALATIFFVDSHKNPGVDVDALITDAVLTYKKSLNLDFTFLYMGNPDSCGHKKGWMSEEYLHHVSKSFDNVKRVIDELGKDHTIIITTDHGGHDTGHGTLLDSDMTIPMFFIGDEFEPGKDLGEISIMDLAPTISEIMGVTPSEDWVGKTVLSI